MTYVTNSDILIGCFKGGIIILSCNISGSSVCSEVWLASAVKSLYNSAPSCPGPPCPALLPPLPPLTCPPPQLSSTTLSSRPSLNRSVLSPSPEDSFLIYWLLPPTLNEGD